MNHKWAVCNLSFDETSLSIIKNENRENTIQKILERFNFFSAYSMVLVLNGVLQEECPMDTHSLFMQHPVYRETANQLLSIPSKTVSCSTLSV